MESDLADIHGIDSSSSPPPSRRRISRAVLPTRVSSACERCRLHKSRCDPYWPCSLCVRANVDCRQRPVAQARRRSLRQQEGSNKSRRISRRRVDSPPVSSAVRHLEEGGMGDHPSRGTGATTTRTRAQEADISGEGRTNQSPIEPGEAESAMGIARKICELGSQHLDEQTTSAIPGYSATSSAPLAQESAADHRRPISSILGQPFPSMDLVYTLLDDYFDAVHWFSLVVHEPKFRRRLQSIADGCAHPAERPFLLLVAVMLGMAAWYRSRRGGPDATHDWGQWSSNLFKVAESDLVDMMDRPSVFAAQTCILIGSHNLYHGRPNLSFTLLGATIKMAHAIGLHREPPQGDADEIEERKRVWWTIYTWDRFASITYGTPLGINDKDCNLSMPADVFEDPSFGTPRSDRSEPICYSPYQRELNRLYLIASPALETIFGSRTSRTSQELVGDTFVSLVKQATENLQVWRQSLPSHLVLDLQYDFQMDGRQISKAHVLQALALQLTYDNILIVLHRPLIARQVDHLSTNKLSPGGSEVDPTAFMTPPLSSETPSRSPFEGTLLKAQTASSEFWMKAAVRMSRVTELPVLAQLATDSHLVAFLAINLFNAAIVLAVMALSNPLSDTAQEVKRTMTRILRLQDLLGKRSALSKQSTHVLKKVITMLLRRESAAMLAPLTGTAAFLEYDSNKQAPPEPHPMSVEDTLRLPLDAPLDLTEPLGASQGGSDVIRTHRLNDSLTSVQYLMVPGNDCTLHVPVLGDSQRDHMPVYSTMPPTDLWQPPAQNAWQGTSPTARQESHYGNVENGLYWLWDTTWNGL